MIISLMKILPCKECVEFLLDGNLYCNTVRYFRDEGYDEFEGAAFVHPTSLRISSHAISAEDLAGPMIVKLDVVANLNVFCMFSWRMPKVGNDKMMFDLESQLGSIRDCIAEFGPYTVVVKDTTEFFRRVEVAIKDGRKSILAGVRGVVRYVNPNTHRSNLDEFLKLPLFKQNRFAHQKVYRFVFRTGRERSGPLVLPIGDIRDIAFCVRTEDVYDNVTVEEKMSSSSGELADRA